MLCAPLFRVSSHPRFKAAESSKTGRTRETPSPAEELFANSVRMPAGSITASKSDAYPVHASGKAEPGDTMTYTVDVANQTGADATNVTFQDMIDANTTRFGSDFDLRVSPVGLNDSYATGQDTPLNISAPGVLANDSGVPAPTVGGVPGCADVTAPFACSTTGGGTVTLSADGSFNYSPGSGFTGTDTFTYTATNGQSAPNPGTDDVATVSINVDAAPAVTTTTPTNSATGVATNTNITINFSESVNATTSSFTIECPAPGNNQTFTVSGSGTNAITLDPSADLPAGTTCTVTVIANQISDTDTNDPPDNMAANYVFSFTTDAPPSVTTTSPANSAINVVTNTNIVVNFSENVNVNASSFTINCGGSQAFGFSGSGTSAITLDPTVDLPAGTTCTVTAVAAQIADSDANDPPNNMVADYVFSFTTDAAPAVTTTTPANTANTIAIDTNIVVNFSENVNVNASSFTINCSGAQPFGFSGSGTSSITLDPTSNLPAGTSCTVTVVANQVADSDANDPPNNMVANYVFSFTTDAGPTVTTTSPTNGATNVAANTNIVINFSENVNIQDATAFTVQCPVATPITFTVTPAAPGGTNSFTLDPTSDLPFGTLCTVTVVASKVSDVDAGDPPDNMSVDHVFTFTVDSPPSVTTTVPTNNATNIAQSSTITINFSENVNVAAGGVTINCGSGVAFTPTLPQNNTSSLVLTPTGGLPAGSNCTVTVDDASVTDTDTGDPPDNMTADYVFTFKVKPDAVNDNVQTATGQTVLGNVNFTSANIPYSTTSNDVSANAFTVTAFDATSANGGTVSVAANGQFTYNPSRGFEGSDTFNYTISRTDGGGSDTATVTIDVGGMIWFIQDGAAACAPQCGRLTNPYPTLAAFNTDNALSGGLNPDNNDNIFIYEDATAYTGAVTLRSGQKLIGQDATATLYSITGLTQYTGHATLPAMNSGNGIFTNLTNTITLHNNSVVRGLRINVTGTDKGLVAVTKTGLVVNEVATISSQNNTAVDFSANSNGTFTFTNISASGSGAGLNFSSTTSGSTVTINNITTTTGAAMTTSSTGATDFTVNDVTSTTGTAVSVTTATGDFIFHAINANGGGAGSKGIALNSATGTFVVNGSGTSDGSGGTIQSKSRGAEFIASNNITLKNMNFTANGTNQTVAGSAGTCGGNLRTGNNLGCVSNIHLQTVVTASFDNLNVTNSGQVGINGNAVSGFTLLNSSVTGNGNESMENGLTFQNLSGTVTITDSIIKNNASRQIHIGNIANNTSTTIGITGTRTNNAYPTMDTSTTMIGNDAPSGANTQQGILLETFGGTTISPTLNLTGVVFNNNYPQNAVDIQPLTSGTLGGTTSGCSFDTNAGGVIISMQNAAGGTYDILNTEFNRTNLQSILYGAGNPTSGTLQGTIQGNTIGTAGQSGSACFPTTGSNCTGIDVNFIGGNGAIRLKIGGSVAGQGNTIQQFDGNGIRIVANGGAGETPALHATIQNNALQAPLGTVANGIDTNIGTTASSAVFGCFNISGNSVTGTYDNPGPGELGIHTRVRFLSEHRLPGMSGTGTANAQTFLTSQNPGAAGKIFVEGTGVPGYQSGAACVTPLLLAEGGIESTFTSDLSSVTTSLSQGELDSIVRAAKARWTASGLGREQQAATNRLRFEIGDLGQGYLGEASDNLVVVDRDAGGKGWFIDATPGDDVEFNSQTSGTRRYTDSTSAAAGRIDLLTAIEHEIGHKLGLSDGYAERDRDSIMYGYLTVGERRVPASGEAATARAEDLPGAHFLKLNEPGVRSQKSEVRRNYANTARKSGLVTPASGETLSHTIGTLPNGKSVRIVFKVTVDTPYLGGANISNQGTVAADGGISVQTDDPAVGGTADPTLTPVAGPPVANDDNYNGFKNTPLNVSAPGVLGNDTNGPSVSAVGGCADVTDPFTGCATTQGGTVTVNADGSFSYTPPNATFTGADSFSYTATNAVGSDTATVNITVADTAAIYLNEVLFNPPGGDAPNEYIELRGAASSTIPAGTYLLAIEGDAADNPGDVQTIIDLSGLTFGSNGYLVLLQQSNTYVTAGGATVVTSTTTGFGGLGLPSLARWSADAAATDLPDASITFMLIQTAVAPALTDDIDANDDGTPDGTVYGGWSVRDSIGALDGSATGDRTYGALNFSNNTATPGTATGATVAVSFIPSYVGRNCDSTGSTAADWVASGALGGAAPNWTLGSSSETEPAGFPGKPLNHIGSSNFANVGPVNNVPGAQAMGEDTTLTFNAGNSNLISISDADAGTADIKVTLTATNGTFSLSGTTGLTFTPPGTGNDGTADTQMVFTGSITNINNALNGLTFTSTPNFNGAASLSLLTEDQGNTGCGGNLTDSDTINITVNPDLEVSIQDASIAEPASGSASMAFTVVLSAPAPGPVAVDFTTADEPPGVGKAVGSGCAGGDYTTTTGTVNFTPGQQVKAFSVPVCSDGVAGEPDETFLVNLSTNVGADIGDGQATGTITAANPAGTILISELRTAGDAGAPMTGAGNEFVELYNNTDAPVDISGYGLFKMGAVCADPPVLIGTVPAATTIPARGHFLFVGSEYGLSSYATGDATLTTGIETDGNVALFNTTNPANLSTLTRLDAVGFGANVNGTCDLLREGSPLPAVGAAGLTTEHSFFRKLCDFNGGCTTPGTPKDTNDNTSDFMLADTAGTNFGPGQQHLGAPGPENLGSPLRKDPSINIVVLDASVAPSSAPNRVRDLTADTPNASQFGTLSVRRRVVNNTANPVTRLRFRIVELTTLPSPGGGQADLRARSSVAVPGGVLVNDTVTCTSSGFGSAPCTVTVNGTTLEQPPNHTAAKGAGYNATLAAGTIAVGTPLAPGASTNVQFLLGVQTTGTFRFLIIVEALP